MINMEEHSITYILKNYENINKSGIVMVKACLESTRERTEPDGISRPALPGSLLVLWKDACLGHIVGEVAEDLDGIVAASSIRINPVVTYKDFISHSTAIFYTLF